MNDIYAEIKQIKADIDGRVKHPYLMKFINVPIIDEQKLILLYVILKQSNLCPEKLKQYILSTMLVQVALDTHEQVTIQHLEDDDERMKNRQLMVLAGDYYSGLYYYLLSLIDDIPMIRVLSNAIKEINEHKIALYQKEPNDLDELMNDVASIDSLLIQKIAEYVQCPELQKLSRELLLINRLNQEKRTYKVNGFSIVHDGIRSILERKVGSLLGDPKQTLHIIDAQIEHSIRYVEKILQRNSVLYDFLYEKVRAFFDELDLTKEKAVKEG
ncbi:heptaprenyl diphosphate synthase component 1 [Calidifontibacillus oryziterrae]|uniref:heptaprenyl diphosphate synthase component 1 n=1 Tax=Calidifontibacillus oryziterrae TaxID=1191699 RepID=UPI0002EC1CEE|nr:heptaprenyl diphosphate synthase component 1 [Calidifontibacillus oryziterrae]